MSISPCVRAPANTSMCPPGFSTRKHSSQMPGGGTNLSHSRPMKPTAIRDVHPVPGQPGGQRLDDDLRLQLSQAVRADHRRWNRTSQPGGGAADPPPSHRRPGRGLSLLSRQLISHRRASCPHVATSGVPDDRAPGRQGRYTGRPPHSPARGLPVIRASGRRPARAAVTVPAASSAHRGQKSRRYGSSSRPAGTTCTAALTGRAEQVTIAGSGEHPQPDRRLGGRIDPGRLAHERGVQRVRAGL